MYQSNVSLTASHQGVALAPSAGSEWIELQGILRQGERLFAVFTAGASQRIVPVRSSDLQTFAAFQRHVADELGLWIRHACEDERTARQQAREWADTVEAAFARGAKA